MKKIITIIILALILTGCSQGDFGAEILNTDTQKINTERTLIETDQAQKRSAEGKYNHVPKYTKDSLDYTINEYIKPNGATGYQIIVETDTHIKGYGYGEDSSDLTFEIEKPPATKASTTR